MQLTKRQTEFWVMLLVLCIIVAAAIMLVDFGIKAAILEESTRLRLTIEEEEVRRSGQRANADRATNVADNNGSIPGDILVVDPGAVEAGNVHSGPTSKVPNPRKRRAQPSAQNRAREVPNGDK